ncbi:CAAX amino terminal protease family [Methanocella conradii HZ254]|uniref:CAAX amino terminal protease family n=1 Tax=Methanocella conradii (strain DSM 24694 / JCM 17849 / CGMCC 1.5162 / HZ254) TaxID=1041930 RepID=H8I6K1_METCZ|nr:CPBP family intramembrane glutamic endopeptidase [Methanocella conradii]AFC98893.1 CAAX amino terminal protease family [Methanocella conradii HZ254]
MRLWPKVWAALLFYLFIGLMVVFFSPWAGIFTYPLVILASALFILALRLRVRMGGFLAGSVAAALCMGLVIAFLAIIGAILIGPLRNGYVYFLGIGIAIQLLVGLGEEMSFRASIFQCIFDEAGFWPAAMLSAAGFAVLHLPSMSLLGVGVESGLVALCTIFLAGVALALLYAYGGLLNAIAFHFTWNFIEYNIFNMGPLEGAISVTKIGPDILTGGAFGPEASAVGLVAVALLIPAIWLYYRDHSISTKSII